MAAAPRLTRELVDRLPARVDERGPIRFPDPPDEYYRDTAARILSAVPAGGDLWVFAIGSLIWKPRFPVVEQRPAVVGGGHPPVWRGPDHRDPRQPAAPGGLMWRAPGGPGRGGARRREPPAPAA
jgi:cation transport protein ChaC